MTEHEYRSDNVNKPDAVGGINRYVIVDGSGKPVIESRSNGSATWLTYKSWSMAQRGLARARRAIPRAMIYDKTAAAR